MQMRNKLLAAAVAAATVLAPAGGALADVTVTPVQPPRLEAINTGTVSVQGEIRLVTNLETPHYEVGGWALMLDDKALLAQLEGRQVQVTGTPFTGMSILMRRQLVVSAIEVTLEGTLIEVTDLEVPHFELGGFVVQGDAAELRTMAGAAVKLTGPVHMGPSVYMKPAVQAESLTLVASAVDPAEPGQIVPAVEVRGVLRFNSQLEGPHYEVDGWVISLDARAALDRLVGKFVTVKGTEYDGMSIFMRPQVVVSELSVTLRGSLVAVTDLETPHYELGGFVLTGAAADLQALSGQEVMVTATLVTSPSIFNQPVLAVSSVHAAAALVPDLVLSGGSKVALPTAAVRQNGQLMLPLRAMIEAAGGLVQWDPVAWAVRVSVAGRSTTVSIGRVESGLGNLPVAPYLESGHTMAPAALFEGLGLELHWEGTTLHVSTPTDGSTMDR